MSLHDLCESIRESNEPLRAVVKRGSMKIVENGAQSGTDDTEPKHNRPFALQLNTTPRHKPTGSYDARN